jgi:hypothetical protein
LKKEPIIEVVAGLVDGSITGLTVTLSAFIAGLTLKVAAFAAFLTLSLIAITNFEFSPWNNNRGPSGYDNASKPDEL